MGAFEKMFSLKHSSGIKTCSAPKRAPKRARRSDLTHFTLLLPLCTLTKEGIRCFKNKSAWSNELIKPSKALRSLFQPLITTVSVLALPEGGALPDQKWLQRQAAPPTMNCLLSATTHQSLISMQMSFSNIPLFFTFHFL